MSTRPVGFYKKDGKTRPITEKKGKSHYTGQTEDPSWKKSSVQDLKQENRIVQTRPQKTVELKLVDMDMDKIVPSQDKPANLDQRAEHFMEMYRKGETIPPMLVHRLPNGKYEIVDGHARYEAYRRLGVKKIPVVENGLLDIAHRIASGIGSTVQKGREVSESYETGKQEASAGREEERAIKVRAARFNRLKKLSESKDRAVRIGALRQMRKDYPEELENVQGIKHKEEIYA